VPPEARWQNLQNQATQPNISELIDGAIYAVERDNPSLKSKLPRDYARRGIEPVKIKGLIDLLANIGFKGSHMQARDTLGRVFEYLLGTFAQAEDKLGGEFYTPRCVVRVLVEMLEPYEGRVHQYRRRGRNPQEHRRRLGGLHRRLGGPALLHDADSRLPVVPHPKQWQAPRPQRPSRFP
jgi:hypothetical protein